MGNGEFQEIDGICIEALCESGVLLWKYVEVNNELTLFGNRNIGTSLDTSLSRWSMNWNDFIEFAVYPEDRENVQRELTRTLHDSGDFKAIFRMKYSEKSSWEWINAFGKSATDANGKKYIRGTIQGYTIQKSCPAESKLYMTVPNTASNIERQLSLILDTMPACCLILDGNGNFECNDVAMRLFGIKSRQGRFGDLSPEFQPDGRRSVEAGAEKIAEIEEKEQIVFEWMLHNTSGELIPSEMTLVRFKPEKIVYIIVYIKDLRKSQAVLAEIEQTQVMLDTVPLCCNYWDENCKNIDCNQEALKLFGISDKQEYLRRFMTELSPKYQPNGRLSSEMAVEFITEAFKTGYLVFEWAHQKLNGEPIPSEIILIRVKHKDRYLIVGYTRDLRELRKTQGERDQERFLLSNILNSSPVCFVIISKDDVKFVTPFTTNFLGITVGDKFSGLFADAQMINQLYRDFDENGFVNWYPVTLKTKSGEVKEMIANILFIEYYNTEAAMVWLVNVTEIKKVEKELRMARDVAEASSRTKSDFLANMSHEIRTPMNAIIGMSSLVLRTELTPKQREYIETTEQSAKLLLRIINDILDFSKIEAGRLVMEYHEFSLQEVIDDLGDLLAESVRKKNLNLSFKLSEELPKYLMGDSTRLRQVLVNLVNNAIKFTNEGSVSVQVDVEEQDALSILLRFVVRDTGIGMTPNQIKMLFRPFMQADASTTRKYGGTGLGLAICKSIVSMMKGEIYCESKPDKGTAFIFTARFGLPLEGDLIDDYSEIRTDALLLGDRPEYLAVIQNYLELLKSKVVTKFEALTDFDEFLKAGRMNEVDFIIFDFENLKQSGMEMYQLLQDKNTKAMPLIAFSEHPDLEQILKEQNIAHNIQIIQKPIIVSDLFNILMAVTAEKKKAMIEEKKIPRISSELYRKGSKFELPEYVHGMKILLAEDNKINQMVATEILKLEGFVVDVAVNGRVAVEMIEKNDYDLVLMDIQMPEMDGLEAAKMIRSNPKYNNLPILAMTAHAMTGDRELSLEAGMNDHITKPIDPPQLFNAIVKWVRR